MADAAFDVVVLGGAFSGAATAILIKRWRPATRVLVVERRERFDYKVGEATVETSALFLHRVMGLFDVLSREHLPKHGLRYWFTDDWSRSFAEMTEVGPNEMPRLASFQLDRSRIDETLLQMAAKEGAEVVRPGRVADVELGFPESTVVVDAGGVSRRVTARWVIDATGRQALLAKKLGHHERVEEHPTSAAWARFTGVADMDSPDLTAIVPGRGFLPPIRGSRRLATNHFCGYGYWCWVIPLGGGQTSIGVVYNKELFRWPGAGTPRECFMHFLNGHPGLRELVANAKVEEDDFRTYDHLPYRTRKYAAKGWALVGDAASFIDPYYSPGLDHCSISAFATAKLVNEDLDGKLPGEALDRRVAEHDEQFLRSYDRWLAALYLGKYEILGDAELVAASYLIDTATYYLGVVGPVYKDTENMRNPILGLDNAGARVAYHALRFMNQRLVRIARVRRRAGVYGVRNVGWRRYRETFGLDMDAVSVLWEGVRRWLKAEVGCLPLYLRAGPRAAAAPGVTATTQPTAR